MDIIVQKPSAPAESLTIIWSATDDDAFALRDANVVVTQTVTINP